MLQERSLILKVTKHNVLSKQSVTTDIWLFLALLNFDTFVKRMSFCLFDVRNHLCYKQLAIS